MKKLITEPLFHFLVLGLCLFARFELVANDEAAYDSQVIDINPEALLTFVQYCSWRYVIGAVASYWMIDRVTGLWA